MRSEMYTITVVGLGYIGLPTACLLANQGFQVNGCDISAHVVDMINQGTPHIVEPELDNYLKAAVRSGNLKAHLNVQPADIFILSVPTPFKEGFEPDLSYVEAATHNMAPCLQPGNIVILESTSPVGTTEKVAAWIAAQRPDLRVPISHNKLVGKENSEQIYIAHCPERVLPGNIMHELVHNDRIIGGIDQASQSEAELFYQQFIRGGILVTDSRTAEMSKLTENAFRDVNIAFANELSMICDKLNINAWELIRLANRHPRVNILQPGPGVGGHCIAVDPWFIVHSAPQHAKLIRQARRTNDEKARYVLEQVKKHAAQFSRPKVACLGLSYKADIDDFRESPALWIVEQLTQQTIGELLVVEPHITALPQRLQVCHQAPVTTVGDDMLDEEAPYSQLRLVDLEVGLAQADIVLLLVNHQAFYSIDRKQLAQKIVIDTRGIWR